MDISQITGSIRIDTTYAPDGEGEALTATWRGGDIIGISKEFLENADPQYVQRSGDIVTIMQFRVQIIQADKDLYLAEYLSGDSHF